MPLKTDLVWGGLAASSADGVSGALPWGTQSSGQRQRPPVPFKRHAAGSARIDSSAPAAARRSPEPLLPRRMRFLTIRGTGRKVCNNDELPYLPELSANYRDSRWMARI